jgi:nucleotide-binding universal stress UspA family protein
MDTRLSPSARPSPADRRGPVVVGVDAVGRSTSAVVWAAEEADRTGAALHLVSAGDQRADGPLAAGAASLARRLTMAELACRVVSGRPVDVLVDQASSASLLVLGRRRRGMAVRMVSGSTSLSVAGRSPAPVVVVPEQWIQPSMSTAPVVVGVSPDLDEEPRDAAVLDFAADRAQRLRVPLVVVGAWDVPSIRAGSPADIRAGRARHERALERQVGPVRRAFPDLEIAVRAVAEPPGQALLDAGRIGQLTVVGRHPRRRADGFSMGATARDVLNRTERPVAVVPVPGATGEEPSPARDVPSWAPMF